MKNLQRSGQAHFLCPLSPDSSLKDRSGFEFALCRAGARACAPKCELARRLSCCPHEVFVCLFLLHESLNI